MSPINKKDETRLYGYDSKTRSRKTFTKVEIRQALRDASKDQDGPLARTAYQTFYDQNPGRPHPYTIIRRYEKWSHALKDAGLPIVKRAPYKSRIDQQDCIAGLLEARKILGHLPSTGEYAALWTYGTPNGSHQPLKTRSYPSVSTIRVKFGTWRDAVTEASRFIDRNMCVECGEPTPSNQDELCKACI